VAKPVFAHTEQAADGKVGDALVAALGAIRHFLLRQAVIDTPIPEGCWVWSGDVNGVKAEQALYRAGTRGYDKPAEQLALAERALELDPTNPWNYRMKGWVYWKLGRRREGLPLMKEAWQRMSAAVDAHPGCRDFELQLEIAYLERSWSYDTQLERLNRAVQLYPNNPSHWDYLGNAIYRVMGDPAAAIAPYRKAYELSPAYFPWYCTYLLAAGKSDEVDPLIEDFRRRSGTEMGPKEQTIAEAQIDQAYVRGDDYRAILTMVDRFVAEGRLPGEPRGLRADYLALTGRLVDAEKWAREAAKGGATTAMMSGGAAQGGGYWLLDWLEKRRTGKVRALTTDEADSYLDNSLWLARLAAASVDLGTTHSLAESLRTAEEEHKDVRIQRVLDVWQYGHGCLALVEGKATEAVNLLEPLAREYGPGSNLPPQHVLGRAYEATGRWADAARAYEAALQKRPFWQMGAPLGPVFVLDQHRLAGIYDRLGNAERARYWYGRFLNDWRNADPGTPEVEDAKRRLAALGGPLPQGG
jgi:tetratricopeptide (TPR) repeat protein